MVRRRLSAAALARLTTWDERVVQNYVKADGPTIPAEFVARCEEEGFVSARWLLLEEGLPDVVESDEEGLRLQVIGRVVDGEIDTATLRDLTQRKGPTPEDVAGVLDRTIPQPAPPPQGGANQKEA